MVYSLNFLQYFISGHKDKFNIMLTKQQMHNRVRNKLQFDALLKDNNR